MHMEGEESVAFALGPHSPTGSGAGVPLARSLSRADAGRIGETFERMRALVATRLDARRTERDQMLEQVCPSFNYSLFSVLYCHKIRVSDITLIIDKLH